MLGQTLAMSSAILNAGVGCALSMLGPIFALMGIWFTGCCVVDVGFYEQLSRTKGTLSVVRPAWYGLDWLRLAVCVALWFLLRQNSTIEKPAVELYFVAILSFAVASPWLIRFVVADATRRSEIVPFLFGAEIYDATDSATIEPSLDDESPL